MNWKSKVTGALAATLALGSIVFTPVTAKTVDPKQVSAGPQMVTSQSTIDAYYLPAAGKTGAALKASLHDIIDNHTQVSYDTVWTALKETDQDPNNANNVIELYTGKSISKSSNGGNVGQWNREHVWAKSHGDFGTSNGPGTDLHHLRPEDVVVNSARGI